MTTHRNAKSGSISPGSEFPRKTTSFSAPYLVFGPMAVVQVLVLAFRERLSFSGAIAYLALGLFAWSLLEYALHRFAFHSTSKHPVMRPFNSTLHLWHHQAPTSLDYIAAPLSLGVPIYGIFMAFCYVSSGSVDVALMVALGTATGYLAYEAVHYMAHLHPAKNPALKYLKKYHLKHHFQDKDNFFGVTSPLWDIVFRTKPAPLPKSPTVLSKP